MYKEFAAKHKELITFSGLFIVFYFIFFHNIGTYPLMDIDETRYVLMSKDMFHSKDFMTLYLNGEYFFEKPPLYFWIECISFKFFGFINEFSARFPAALCGMILSFLVYFSGKKIVNAKYGIVSSLSLASSLEFTILSKYAILDIFLCTFVALSVFSYFMTLFATEANKKYFWWMFYIFSGLAVMAKGIPGVVIPFGTVFFVSLYTRTFKKIFKPLYLLPGIILFLLITLPWHIIMIKAHNTFYHEYIVKHHLQRFVNSKELGRKQPWFYFIVTLLWGLVPWTASIIAAAAAKIKQSFNAAENLSSIQNILKSVLKVPENKAEKFFAINLIAAIVTLLFFSSSSTKLITYILPIYPFAACIVGIIWTNYLEEGKNAKAIDISSYIFSGICLVCAFAALFMPVFLPRDIYELIKPVQLFSIPVICLTQIPALAFLYKKQRKAVFACYVTFIMLLSAFGTPVFYKLDYKFGQNDLMKFATYAQNNNSPLYAINTGRRFSLNYYGNSNNVHYLADIDLNSLEKLNLPDNAVVLIKIKEYKKYQQQISKNFVVIDTGRKYILCKKKNL